MITGLTSGCFDLFHFGHLRYLQRCRERCDRLVVAVDSDEMVRVVKGYGRPIIPERERHQIVSSLRCVTIACVINEVGTLKKLSDIFKVNKVFKNEKFLDISPVIGVHGTSADLEIIADVEGLPETTLLIEEITRKRFKLINQ